MLINFITLVNIVLAYWQFISYEQISVNIRANTFFQENTIEAIVCDMVVILFQPGCIKTPS